MALPQYLVWEVRTTGNNANGGAFLPTSGGTDRSQQDSPHVTFDGTDVTATTTGASATITISGYTVAAGDIGNILNITGGTNFTTGRYYIQSVSTENNTWTLDRDCCSGAASAMTGRMGGCIAYPAVAWAHLVGYEMIHVKAGDYYCTTTTTNVDGGRMSANLGLQMIGYGSERLDFADAPTFYLDVNVGSSAHWFISTVGQIFNVKIVSNFSSAYWCGIRAPSASGGTAIGCSMHNLRRGCVNYIDAYYCSATRDSVYSGSRGFEGNPAYNGFAYNCYASKCEIGFYTAACSNCVAENCTSGFSNIRCFQCLVRNCTYGIYGSGFSCTIDGCTYGMGHFVNDGWGYYKSQNCIITNCTYAFGHGRHFNNATYNCQYEYWSGGRGFRIGTIALTADPFEDRSNGDYRLNATAGGGAALKDQGFTGFLPDVYKTNYLYDLGAATKRVAAAGGGAVVYLPRIIGA